EWAAAAPAAAAVRTGGARPPPSARKALRRRPHGVVPVLPAARGRARPEAGRVPHRRRLARAVDARILAAVRGQPRRLDRLADPARLHPRPPAGVLLLP